MPADARPPLSDSEAYDTGWLKRVFEQNRREIESLPPRMRRMYGLSTRPREPRDQVLSQVMRVAVIGSRDFPRLDLVEEFINQLDLRTIVVSGGARGVDRAAEDYAKMRGLQTDILPAKWEEYGRRAGILRNQEIVDKSDRVMAFWDSKSPGTRHAIHYAISKRVPVVVRIEYIPDGK